jgi:hypothetical protein
MRVSLALGLVLSVLLVAALATNAAASTLCPDGTWVAGDRCTLAPDGSYVGGGRAVIAPDGNWVGAEPGSGAQITPDGSFVSDRARPQICPDGSWVAGRCKLTLGGWVGE